MKRTLLSVALLSMVFASQAQTYSFTNAGVSGPNGPVQGDVTTAYTGTSLDGAVTINTQGIQEWTVPSTGMYHITAIGACGGELQGTYYPGFPGTGATIEGDFMLTAGTVLNIVVGQKGTYGDNGSGGGGGSFVFTGAPGGAGLMIAAGGGGGHGHGSASVPTGANGGGGSADQNQVDGAFGTGNGGSGGVGLGGNAGTGACSYSGLGAGGMGWTSDGASPVGCGASTGGLYMTFVGGNGGGDGLWGGFGGGGGSDGNGSPGGGGGGYTGGGGGNDFNGSAWGAGAGAGSYNTGTNQTNTAGVTGATTGFTHGSVTIDLVCSNPNNGVTLTVATLSSDETNPLANYQWIDCDLGNAEILGETSISYTPTVTGNYAVVVSLNGCSDTSACTLVDFTGINELNTVKFNVYPNPGSGIFNIEIAESGDFNVVVYDLSGKEVFNSELNANTSEINLSGLVKGVYQINISGNGKIATKKLVLI